MRNAGHSVCTWYMCKGKWGGTVAPSHLIARGVTAFLTRAWPFWGSDCSPAASSPCLNLWNFPPVCIYFFPFCQQKKITVLPALSITEISTCGCNYKGPNEGISFAGNASVGKNRRRCLINQALGQQPVLGRSPRYWPQG